MSADPRGPMRTVTGIYDIRPSTSPNISGDVRPLRLSCGHIAECNQIFHYKMGQDMHCFECGPHGGKP